MLDHNRSYERWREEHRSVKAGEHGITYMISTEYEKDGEMRRGYTIGKGFDISQMSGKPLEERPQRSLKCYNKVVTEVANKI